uniref:Uncharacterized protein n=1 Tax=Meloidogyne incognita TaxID=6306 RepID=A0A914NMB1_MELIC
MQQHQVEKIILRWKWRWRIKNFLLTTLIFVLKLFQHYLTPTIILSIFLVKKLILQLQNIEKGIEEEMKF